MAFEVSAGEAAAAVVFGFYVDEDFGVGGLHTGVQDVGVFDDDVGGLRLLAADFVGVDKEFREGPFMGGGAHHDHAVAEAKLGVDDRAVRALVDGSFLEAEDVAEEVEGGLGVAVAQAGDDGAGGVFRFGGHGGIWVGGDQGDGRDGVLWQGGFGKLRRHNNFGVIKLEEAFCLFVANRIFGVRTRRPIGSDGLIVAF